MIDKYDYEYKHSCDLCSDTGIDNESRIYCTACELGKRRMNLDRLTEPLRNHPFTNAMWVAHHSAMKTERAIAAAEMALLKSKLLQKERELAEVRKDAQRYRHLRDAETLNQTIWDALDGIGSDEPEGYRRGFDMAVDAAIDAAMSTPNKGESK